MYMHCKVSVNVLTVACSFSLPVHVYETIKVLKKCKQVCYIDLIIYGPEALTWGNWLNILLWTSRTEKKFRYLCAVVKISLSISNSMIEIKKTCHLAVSKFSQVPECSASYMNQWSFLINIKIVRKTCLFAER